MRDSGGVGTAGASPGPFTHRDYLTFPDDGRRHELDNGAHVVTPSPERRHQQICSRVHVALGAYLLANPLGEVYAAPLDVILSERDLVQPDVLFVSRERGHVLERWVHGAPDLVVEVLSPATRERDETSKRDQYDRFGVREYWVIDPERGSVRIHRRAPDGSFPLTADLGRDADDAITTPLLPGFALPLVGLFAGD